MQPDYERSNESYQDKDTADKSNKYDHYRQGLAHAASVQVPMIKAEQRRNRGCGSQRKIRVGGNEPAEQ